MMEWNSHRKTNGNPARKFESNLSAKRSSLDLIT
jgi:hypothetical protein